MSVWERKNRRTRCPSRKILSGRIDDANRTKIGVATMVPDRWTVRRSGASLPNAKCVRVSLERIQGQDPSQMPFVEDRQIQAVAPQRPNQPLSICGLPRRPR